MKHARAPTPCTAPSTIATLLQAGLQRMGIAGTVFIVVLLVGIAATGLVARATLSRNSQHLHLALDQRARLEIDGLAARMKAFEKGIRGLRGAILVGGQEHMSAETYRIYAESRDLKAEFPGARSFGFIRRDGEHEILQFVSTDTGANLLVGLDVAAQPAIHQATAESARSGAATMTASLTSLLGAEQSAPWCLVMLPIYRPHLPHDTRRERDIATLGWAFAAIDVGEVVAQLDAASDIEFVVRDISPREIGNPLARAGHLRSAPVVATEHPLETELFGRRWALTAQAGTQFAATFHPTASKTVVTIGGVLSLLSAALLAAVASQWKRRNAMQAQQALLAGVVANTSDAIILESPEGLIINWNRAAEHLFGYAIDEALGRRLSDLISRGQQAAEPSGFTPFDDIRRRRDGSAIDVSMTRTPIRAAANELIAIATTIRDISARKAVERDLQAGNEYLEREISRRTEVLQQTERNLRAITDALPSMIAYWDKDLVNRFANGAHQKWHGIDAAAMVGTTAAECFGDEWVERMRPHLDAALRGESVTFETEVAHGDGRLRSTLMVHYIPDIVEREVHGFYMLAHDITLIKEAQVRIAESERFLEQAGAVSGVGGFRIDLRSGAQSWTSQTFKIYDIGGDAAPSAEELDKLMDPPVATRLWQAIRVAAETGVGYDLEIPVRTPHGRSIWIRTIGVVEFDNQTPSRVVGAIQDITDRKNAEAALIDAARRDKLTGLANRALFMDRLEKSVARVKQGNQPYFAVLFLDFDRFKLINDTLGHDAGDELLRQIAERLRHALRASDALTVDDAGNVVSRFGGDEFLLLINDLKSPDDAVRIADRLLNTLAPAYLIDGNDVHSSASIGIITSDRCASSAEDVVRNADVAMYEAKRAGRACSVVFDEAMHTKLARHVSIENNLRRAIGTSELHLVYQPIVDLATRQMVSAEALIRWNHPTLGAISPSEFIPIAEETGLIVALGEWVQDAACRAMAQWRASDPARAPATISVNVSRAELALGGRLLEQLRTTLDRHGLPARCLQLEVTEREIMRHPEAAHALMLELQSLGVKLAMDDFGTGTSSLGFLRNYPFDTIKIDQSFIQDVANNPDVLAVIHATINLVENLGMASLAEGVEEADQVAILQSLGCRYGQGYFFSRPVAADKLITALDRSRTAMAPGAVLSQ